MNRVQVGVVTGCVLLLIGLYLFTDIKKPKKEGEKAPMTKQAPNPESLDIEQYLSEVNVALTDSSLKAKVAQLKSSQSYGELAEVYQKQDKPLAVAYYVVKKAEAENSANSFVQAGDYNAMLIQSAPDEKARHFLSDNILYSYEKAAELDTANTTYKLRLAGAYIENTSQPMQGISILMNIVSQDSNNVGALLMLGRFGIVSGQYEKAIARLEKVLYLRPQNSEALLLMAEAYNSKGDKSKAIEYLERCKKTVSNPELKREIENHIKSIKKPQG